MRSFVIATVVVPLALLNRAAFATPLVPSRYEVTGTNAHLPDKPTPVAFDGVEEVLVDRHGHPMRVNETVREVGGQTWLEFSFEVDPGVGLAGDINQLWEIGVTNLQFDREVFVPFERGNAYVYFTQDGKPVGMELPLGESGAHPFNAAISQVWYHAITDFDPASPHNDPPPDVEPSETLNLFHQYRPLGQVLAKLHVPAGVNGFHFGVHVVPEPSSLLLLVIGGVLAGGLGWRARRRRIGAA